jgi:hypothetical protein
MDVVCRDPPSLVSADSNSLIVDYLIIPCPSQITERKVKYHNQPPVAQVEVGIPVILVLDWFCSPGCACAQRSGE